MIFNNGNDVMMTSFITNKGTGNIRYLESTILNYWNVFHLYKSRYFIRKLNQSVKGKQKISKIWHFERNEHCSKFNLASAIGHITVMFFFFSFFSFYFFFSNSSLKSLDFIHSYCNKFDKIIPIKIKWNIIAELWRAKRACGAPWVSKSTHPRKFGNHVTVHRPPVRPHHGETNVQSHTF